MKNLMNLRLSLSGAGIKAWAVRAALLALPLIVAACTETNNDTDEYPDWQSTNTAYWNNLYTTTQSHVSAGDESWKIFKTYTIEDSLPTANTYYIIAHVLQAGTGAGCPLSTDSVSVRYTGRLLPSTSYPSGYVFDTTSPAGTTDATAAVAHMAVSALTPGFATALQHMHVGDTWEVYVPWTLAYGTEGNGAIPGYSVLKFDITLRAYARAGAPLPVFQ